MRTLIAGFAILALTAGSTVVAQEVKRVSEHEPRVSNPPTITPEMWEYIQELRRQDDPKLNARRVAQAKADQRRARLASQAWYGYSNSRPMVSPSPFTANAYSPMWAGNGASEFQWTPNSASTTNVYVEENYRR